jgi:uncharacterized protein (TIGR02147 family)
MPDIYQYTDYRAFLRDYFAEQKAARPGFSHQYFARRAGIKSTGFVLHVIKGERNLTRPVMLGIARAIGFNPKQTGYFEDLVSFCQAKNQNEREYYFNRVSALRKKIRVSALDDKQYAFYSEWHHAVLRELVNIMCDETSAAAFAKTLIPPIDPKQAKQSLSLMEELGVLKKDHSGKYRQAEQFISGGGQVRSTAIVAYQKEMLEQAKRAWDRFSTDETTMHTVTLCMSEGLLERVRQEVRDFKERLLDMAGSEEKNPERVYHLNINLFPVTKAIQGEKT